MNIETKQQQKHPKPYQQQQQQQSQHQHHAHCSYDKDIVCDNAQMHKQKHQHHSHQPHSQSYQQCEKSKISDQQYHQQQQQQQPYQYCSKQQEQQQTSSFSHRHHQHQSQPQTQTQAQRKYSHSHSPHHSRHTSPHSHHSHSLHSSPHQSHQHVNGSANGGSGGIDTSYQSPTRTAHSSQRPSTEYSSSSHAHHHHHHRRRSRRNHGHNTSGNGSGGGSGGGSGNSSIHGPHGHSHNSQEHSGSRQHTSSCSRRHRSATDISSVSLNTCHNENCIDREVQEIFVRKNCCSSSRTELAQFFAEDLYGSSRRPSSCCTSSDYCYQTDSTSLYGSRSSLSRNNSIKSASISMRKKRALHQRQPSYTSISLRGVQSSQPSNRQQQLGSLTTVFDRQKSKSTEAQHGEHIGSGRMVLSPSKVTIERQTSKDTCSQELPECSCSPSNRRWSFLADEKTQFEMDAWKKDETERPKPIQPRKPHRQSKQDLSSTKDEKAYTTPGTTRKRRERAFSCEFEESSTTVLFHQEGEAYNNCCNNYIQCNTYLDQDLQITSEDIHQYLSKGNHTGGDILNNSKNYPFQPSNALEFHYKNNFANNNTTGADTITAIGTGTGTNTTAESSEGADSVIAANDTRFNVNRYRRNSSKETNLNQHVDENAGACGISQPTNINLSSSTNNINIIFNSSTTASMAVGTERNANEVKFINTASRGAAMSNENRRSSFMPYDCANMSSNSYFDKPLGIDELPKEFEANAIVTKATATTECSEAECSSSDGQHSSPLPSPVQTGVSFESFDAPSDHNLISQRGSCQFSSPTLRSPLTPSSPACSSLSASALNTAPSTYVVEPLQHHQPHQYYSYEPEHQSQPHSHHHHHRHHHHSPTSTTQNTHHRHSHQTGDCYQHHHHHHHHANDSFKLSNAFKKVRKRARKYTDFLRKK